MLTHRIVFFYGVRGLWLAAFGTGFQDSCLFASFFYFSGAHDLRFKIHVSGFKFKDQECLCETSETSVSYVNGVSEALFKIGMCLPAGPYVTDDDVRYIVETIKGAIER